MSPPIIAADTAALLSKPLLSVREVCAVSGFSRSALWRRLHDGRFPPPIDYSDQSAKLYWSGVSVRRWIEDRLEGVARDWRKDWPRFQGTADRHYKKTADALPSNAARRPFAFGSEGQTGHALDK